MMWDGVRTEQCGMDVWQRWDIQTTTFAVFGFHPKRTFVYCSKSSATDTQPTQIPFIPLIHTIFISFSLLFPSLFQSSPIRFFVGLGCRFFSCKGVVESKLNGLEFIRFDCRSRKAYGKDTEQFSSHIFSPSARVCTLSSFRPSSQTHS